MLKINFRDYFGEEMKNFDSVMLDSKIDFQLNKIHAIILLNKIKYNSQVTLWKLRIVFILIL